MGRGIVRKVQWCDTRDVTVDGHTKGSIDRYMILQVMGGTQSFERVLRQKNTLHAWLGRQDRLSHLRSNRLQGDLRARQLVSR
eukprot:134768-Pyramimonas_sp.AAC.1